MSIKVASLIVMGSLLLGCTRQVEPFPHHAQAPRVDNRLSARWLPPSVRRFDGLIAQSSLRHRVDANLLALVILVESGGNPVVSSPRGAIGLMQIMPATGREIARQLGIIGHVDARLFDPAYNIDFGAYYLARQLSRFRTTNATVTVERAAAAYNGGPGRLARHLRTGQPLPMETMRYKRWVAGMWHERYLPVSPMFSEWWSAGGRRLVVRSNVPILF